MWLKDLNICDVVHLSRWKWKVKCIALYSVQYSNIEIHLGCACMLWRLITRFGVTEALWDFSSLLCVMHQGKRDDHYLSAVR